MRLGRLLLAGLTALVAYSYAQSAPTPADAHESLRLLKAVVPLLAHAADSLSSAPVANSAAHAVFAVETLIATPLAGSLCLIASVFAIDLLRRRNQRSLLRC